jgi:hypothetical protein
VEHYYKIYNDLTFVTENLWHITVFFVSNESYFIFNAQYFFQNNLLLLEESHASPACPFDRSRINIKINIGMALTGGNRRARRKTCPSATLFTNLKCAGKGTNSGLR